MTVDGRLRDFAVQHQRNPLRPAALWVTGLRILVRIKPDELPGFSCLEFSGGVDPCAASLEARQYTFANVARLVVIRRRVRRHF